MSARRGSLITSFCDRTRQLTDPLTKAIAVGFALAMLLLGFGCTPPKPVERKYISYLGAAWGLDGDTIYFLKQIRGSGIWFCKMNWDGSQKQEIARMWPGQDAYVDTQNGPIWMEVNAATSNVVFDVEYGMGTVCIWVIGLNGKYLHKPFEPVWNEKEKERVLHPSWSLDGSKLVYCKDSRELWTFDFKTKKRTKLTDGPRDEHPTWSPKGDWIAFTHNRYDNGDKGYTDRRVWLIRPDGSGQQPVVDEKNQPIFGWWPSWNPDGTRISIAGGLLTLADVATNRIEKLDPLYIIGERSPWLFLGHHWAGRGWLLAAGRNVIVMDSQAQKGRTVGAGGVYSEATSSSREQWGIAPTDLEGKKR